MLIFRFADWWRTEKGKLAEWESGQSSTANEVWQAPCS
jgi:hypothetical protein